MLSSRKAKRVFLEKDSYVITAPVCLIGGETGLTSRL
jgi:hypothetical protein